MIKYALILTIATTILLFFMLFSTEIYERPCRKQYLSRRVVLRPIDIKREFPDIALPDSLFCKIWLSFGEALHVDCGRLRATDTLESLKFIKCRYIDDSSDVDKLLDIIYDYEMEYQYPLERFVKCRGANESIYSLTLGDVVEYINIAYAEYLDR